MKYQLQLIDNIVVILIDENELFAAQFDNIVEVVKNEITKGNTAFILNLENIKYLNSTGLNFLISVLTVIRNHEGELVLAALSEKIENLLVVTKLNAIFNVKGSVGESIEFLKNSKIEQNQA